MDIHIQAEQLAQRPYSLVTSIQENTDNQPIHFARVLEMDGCFGQGRTQDEAVKDLQLAMVDFIESLIEDGLHVPEPGRLTNTTVNTSSEITVTFVSRGNRLKPKPNEIYRDTHLVFSRNN